MENWICLKKQKNKLKQLTQKKMYATKSKNKKKEMTAFLSHLFCDPTQMFDLHTSLHALHLLLHSWQKVGNSSLYGVVPGLSHGWVFCSQEHRVLSVGRDHLKIPDVNRGEGRKRRRTKMEMEKVKEIQHKWQREEKKERKAWGWRGS